MSGEPEKSTPEKSTPEDWHKLVDLLYIVVKTGFYLTVYRCMLKYLNS